MLGEIICNLVGAAFLFPLGLALGSFLELVADRVPRGESILWPPSHCRVCSHRLSPDELIPIVSYLAQHGRCRNCDSSIGRGVPFREALSGAAVGLPWLIVGCAAPIPALIASVFFLAAGWTGWMLFRQGRDRPP